MTQIMDFFSQDTQDIDISYQSNKSALGKLSPETISGILKELHEHPAAVSLSLRGQTITDELAGELAALLKANRKITLLDVSHANLTCEGASRIIKALYENETLKSLYLSHNRIEKLDVKWECVKGLSLLSMAFNYQYDPSQLLDDLINNHSVTHLQLDCCDLSGDKVPKVATFISQHSCLVYLGLNNCQLGTVAPLTEVIASAKALRELDLRDNNLQDADAMMLANALRRNSSLIIMNLYHNAIAAKGSRALSQSLTQNSVQGRKIFWNFEADSLAIATDFGWKAKYLRRPTSTPSTLKVQSPQKKGCEIM